MAQHPQLRRIADEFGAAADRFDALTERLDSAEWARRPRSGGWSPIECIAHLNITARAFLPVLDRGLEEARAMGGGAPRRYRRDPIGWALWRVMRPPVRMRTKTPPSFAPPHDIDPQRTLDEFRRLHAEQVARLGAADGLPLSKVKIPSPFSPHTRYNLFSALSIIPRHELRHLWQAEQTLHDCA